MSFSAELKTEMARTPADRACCREAELRALTGSAASYILKGRGQVNLVYRFGSIPAARRTFVLLKQCFGIVPALEYSISPAFGGRRVCILRVEEGETRRLMHLPHGPLHTMSPRMLGRKCCFRAYLRGVFLAAGYMTDPVKNYHIEMTFPSPGMARRCSGHLSDMGINAQCGERDRETVLALDRGDDIAALLPLMGAPSAMLRFENIRMHRDSKERANRMLNCDRANLKKQTAAGMKLAEALRAVNVMDLKADLKTAAELRIRYPEASVAELAALCDPPVTKSGMYHRLQKLQLIAEGKQP